ncbi:MAG: HD domain-containing protein [Candidatus Saccharimonadales bacterium]
MAIEERTAITFGRQAENIAQHSNMLAIIAPVLAQEYFTNLNARLVARFCPIHETVEAYVQDTPTHRIDEAGLQSKAKREKQGLARLEKD